MSVAADQPGSSQRGVFDVLCEYLADRGDEIALAVAYGSFVAGSAGPLSDVDLYYVPGRLGARPADLQVIVAGIGYDVFGLDWQRLERIADLREPLLPLILDARVVHSRDPADLARLHALQLQARGRLADIAYRSARAREILDRVARGLVHLGPGGTSPRSLSVTRLAAFDLAGELVTATAYLHGNHPARGLSHLIDKLRDQPWMPAAVADQVTRAVAASTSAEVLAALTAAYLVVDQLHREATAPPRTPSTPPEQLRGFYEELLSASTRSGQPVP
ncbi:MAG: hypothetical protein ACOYEV_16250 [Candidatus Nanopelagicales bacterium]